MKEKNFDDDTSHTTCVWLQVIDGHYERTDGQTFYDSIDAWIDAVSGWWHAIFLVVVCNIENTNKKEIRNLPNKIFCFAERPNAESSAGDRDAVWERRNWLMLSHYPASALYRVHETRQQRQHDVTGIRFSIVGGQASLFAQFAVIVLCPTENGWLKMSRPENVRAMVR